MNVSSLVVAWVVETVRLFIQTDSQMPPSYLGHLLALEMGPDRPQTGLVHHQIGKLDWCIIR